MAKSHLRRVHFVADHYLRSAESGLCSVSARSRFLARLQTRDRQQYRQLAAAVEAQSPRQVVVDAAEGLFSRLALVELAYLQELPLSAHAAAVDLRVNSTQEKSGC